jgi:hypothetical protein
LEDEKRQRRKEHYNKMLSKGKMLLRFMRSDYIDIALRIQQYLARQPAVPHIIQERFATEGRSQGKAWWPLAVATQADRIRKGYGGQHPILRRTGGLRRAAEGGSVEVRDLNTLEMVAALTGELEKYAEALNEGYEPHNLPSRPFYGEPSPEELKELLDLRNELIMRVVAALGNGESLDNVVFT